MNIGIIWKNDYPWDVRIEKIANALSGQGHEVHIMCSNTKKLPRDELLGRLHVVRLPAVANGFLNSLLSLPFHFNPFWMWMVVNVVRQQKLDLIIIRDVPLISIALYAKRKFRIPVILDMAENYPAMYWNKVRSGGWAGIKSWFIKNPQMIEYAERQSVRDSDHILVVVEESAARLTQRGVEPRKISIVSNTPDYSASRSQPTRRAIGVIQLVYAGFVQERGLDTVVRALSHVRTDSTPLRFLVVGDGDYLVRLKEITLECGVEDLVVFTGWVDNKLIPGYIADSDIGVIPHRKNDHTDTTVPNKLFDYMAEGKPVIVSNAAPLERIVTEEDCGLVFSSGDVESFARVLRTMLADPLRREQMGKNGAEAVKRRYNWQYDAATLRDVVARVRDADASRT